MHRFSSGHRLRAGRPAIWFILLTGLGVCVQAASNAILGTLPQSPGAWAVLVAVALVAGSLATVSLDRLLLDRSRRMAAEVEDLRVKAMAAQEMQRQLAGRAEQQRRLRHDIRGALSPAMLMADRLVSHTDPKVRRAGEILVQCVDKAISLLADPAEADVSPRAGS